MPSPGLGNGRLARLGWVVEEAVGSAGLLEVQGPWGPDGGGVGWQRLVRPQRRGPGSIVSPLLSPHLSAHLAGLRAVGSAPSPGLGPCPPPRPRGACSRCAEKQAEKSVQRWDTLFHIARKGCVDWQNKGRWTFISCGSAEMGCQQIGGHMGVGGGALVSPSGRTTVSGANSRVTLGCVALPAQAQPCGEAPCPLVAAPFVPLEVGTSSPQLWALVTGHSGACRWVGIGRRDGAGFRQVRAMPGTWFGSPKSPR